MKIKKIIIYLVLISIAITFSLPFFWMILMAMADGGSLIISPEGILNNDYSLDTFNHIFSLGYGKYIGNSFFVSIVTTVLQLLFAAMAGYALARFEFKGKTLIYRMILSLLMVPFIVVMIPLFIEMKYMNLIGTYGALIYPKVFSAFAIFFMRQFFLSLPRELEEAAYIDGCSTLKTFFVVILPQMKTALATMGILAFMGSWNDYLWPLVIHSSDTMTLPIALNQLSGQYTTEWNVVMAGAIISIIPIIIVFLFGQKYMVAGVTNTGNK